MLILPIKKKWFDMILSGEKKEEYREIKPYYLSRLKNEFDMYPYSIIPVGTDERMVMFRNGYRKDSPAFIADCTLDIKAGKEEWGAERDTEYFVLTIKKIRWTNIDKIKENTDDKKCS